MGKTTENMGKRCHLIHNEKVLIHDVYHIKCMLHTVNCSCEILRNFAIEQNKPFRPIQSGLCKTEKNHRTWFPKN